MYAMHLKSRILNMCNESHTCATSAWLSVPVRSIASCNRAASTGSSDRGAFRLIAPPFPRFIEAGFHDTNQLKKIYILYFVMVLQQGFRSNFLD